MRSRRYREGLRRSIAKNDADQLAGKAKEVLDGGEGEVLRDAERKGQDARDFRQMTTSSADTTRAEKGATGAKHADPCAPGLRRRFEFMVELFSDTAERFSDNEGYRLGAAFSYYATFSIFPVLLLSVTVVGFLLGDSMPARERMLEAIATPDSPVRDIVDRTLTAMQENRSARGVSAFVGLGTLLFGASGAFVELDAALNRIWCVPERRAKGILGSIRLFLVDRLSGFTIVLALGLLLLVSLISSALLSFLVGRAQEEVSMPLWPAVARTAELTLSVATLTAAVTAAFHLIPRAHPPVRIVAPGALLTTVFFLALKEVFASYLAHLTSYSAYGVAGGVLALATWIYLSSMILFFGAQLTRVHAEKLKAVPVCDLEYRTGVPKHRAGASSSSSERAARSD